MRSFKLLLFCLIFCSQLLAQRGKDGLRVISSPDERVNEYATLSNNVSAGSTTITVSNNNFNGNGRFASALAKGDLLLIYQAQGATIRGTLTGIIGTPLDSTWGEITGYNNCGNYEFVQVAGVAGVNQILLSCPLKNNYTATGRTQVVRVPRLSQLTVNNTAYIGCEAWNGSIGGIVAIEVKGNTTINAGGRIDVSEKGFRGGLIDNNSTYGVNNVASTSDTLGAMKGEGIAGYQSNYTPHGGAYCKGAAANAGGGGNGHNAGGGGGANGGNPVSWTGHGIPDLTNPGWAAAWNLEYAGFSSLTSSGGGQGGYTFNSNNGDALTLPPDDPGWGGDRRNNQGGLGGRPLDYSTGKIFFGGGGGAGDQNDGYGGNGGRGGGMVFLISYGTVSGAGQINANGEDGDDACCSSTFGVTGNDGAGGGGAGGTIVIESTGNISGITLNANGGNGGNQDISPTVGGTNEAEGPGGGGSGGYIALSNLGATQNVNGGVNGTTDSDGLTEFPPNGATKGGDGTKDQVLSAYTFSVNPRDTVCSGMMDTLLANITGSVPSGVTLTWYDSAFGGNQLGTGSQLITGPFVQSKTIYVGFCPGTYRDSVRVVVGPSINVTGTPSVCSGFSTALNATGAQTYGWSPATGLSSTAGSSVIVTPTSATTYTVIGTAINGCTDTTTFSIGITPPPVLTVSNDTTVCKGDPVQINISGANSFLWSPAAGLTSTTGTSATATPSVTTTYLIIGTDLNGCIDTAEVEITVNAPFVEAGANDSICIGDTLTLTANASNYLWNTGATTASITVSPSTSVTYTVSTDNGLCTNSDTVFVYVSGFPVAGSGGDQTILYGDSVTLTPSGGSTYVWSPANGLSCTNCENPKASPSRTTTYTVTVYNVVGCYSIDSMTIVVDTSALVNNCGELYVPNLFTPNGDGVNDVFFVRGDCIDEFTFQVFDRWGKLVFTSQDPLVGWDGLVKGEPATVGTYVYQVDVILDTGEEKFLSGSIDLLR